MVVSSNKVKSDMIGMQNEDMDDETFEGLLMTLITMTMNEMLYTHADKN